MNSQWHRINHQFDSRSMRERVMILAAGLALIIGIPFMLWIDPALNEYTKLESERKKLHAEEVTATTIRDSMLAEFSKLKNNDQDIRLQKIQNSIDALDNEFEELTVDLIAPQNMAVVLQQMVKNIEGLKLKKLNTMPVEILFGEGEVAVKNNKKRNSRSQAVQEMQKRAESLAKDKGDNAAEHVVEKIEPRVAVYKHGLELHLTGSYRHIVSYIKKLEQLPWKFYWQKLDYEVEKYPSATVVLQVYTLSINKNWLGVLQ